MSEFDVYLPAVRQTVSVTADSESGLRSELAKLSGLVDDVLGGRWRGAAATAFDAAWSDWRLAASQVITCLGRMGEVLSEVGCAYESRDEVQSGEFRLVLS